MPPEKISEKQAREIATKYANSHLSGKKFELSEKKRIEYKTLNPKSWDRAVKTGDKWILEIQPPAGFFITVSMDLYGKNIKIDMYGLNPV